MPLHGQPPHPGFTSLRLQEESEEDWEAAASQVAHTIQHLSELAEAEASRQGR